MIFSNCHYFQKIKQVPVEMENNIQIRAVIFCSSLLHTQASCEELVRLVGKVVASVEVNWKAVLAL